MRATAHPPEKGIPAKESPKATGIEFDLEFESGRAYGALMISEIYPAVCGEGREIGLPATFVRTSGCNLRCPGWPCDTPYTSVKPVGTRMTGEEVFRRTREIGLPRVFLTGGEPLLWRKPLRPLLERFKAEGWEVLLQSNGTIYAEEIFALCDQVSLDCKTPSSGEVSDLDVIRRAVREAPEPQVKFVIRDDADYEYAEETHRTLEGDLSPEEMGRCAFVLQPMDAVGSDDAASLLARLRWLQETVQRRKSAYFRVLPQLHILLYGSEKRGV
jgi:7-carboxy-7-deazaguanine synthase